MTQTTQWADTYVRREMVNPKDLVAHPLNARRHPAEQVDVLEGSLDELGWIDDITVNETTGRMIDGHARVELAIARGEPLVPVTYRRMTSADEHKALLIKDPIAALAATDTDAVRKLIEYVDTENEAIQAMLKQMTEEPPIVMPEDDAHEVSFLVKGGPDTNNGLRVDVTYSVTVEERELIQAALRMVSTSEFLPSLDAALAWLARDYLEQHGE